MYWAIISFCLGIITVCYHFLTLIQPCTGIEETFMYICMYIQLE